jgi:hypothetical protein
MPKIAIFCLMLLVAVNSAAQSLVKCEDKSTFWVIKKSSKTFAIHLHGDVAPSDVPELINIEDYALHYNLLSKSAYLKKGGGGSDTAVLTRFIKGEEKFLTDKKMTPEYAFHKLPSGKTFLLWHHDWHGTEVEVEQQVHATIILDEMVIWLSSPKYMGQDLAKVEAFLTETIANVKSVKSKEGLCGK